MSSFVAINKRQFLEKSPNKEAKVLNEYRPKIFSRKTSDYSLGALGIKLIRNSCLIRGDEA